MKKIMLILAIVIMTISLVHAYDEIQADFSSGYGVFGYITRTIEDGTQTGPWSGQVYIRYHHWLYDYPPYSFTDEDVFTDSNGYFQSNYFPSIFSFSRVTIEAVGTGYRKTVPYTNPPVRVDLLVDKQF